MKGLIFIHIKKIFALLIAVILLLSGCTTKAYQKEENLTLCGSIPKEDGTLAVEVTFNNGSILDIDITDIDSNYENALPAAKDVAYEIISQQSLSVDTVVGATKTSKDTINAVTLALESGGISPDLFIDKGFADVHEERKNTYDIVIIGSGAAGLSAAIQATENGKDVLIIEKMPFAGGSTALSGGEISIPENILSMDQPQNDSPETMLADMMRASQNTANPKLANTICTNIADTVLWLIDSAGIKFSNDVYKVNGHSYPRTTFPDGGGATLINKMVLRAEELGVKIIYNVRAKNIIQNENGKALGVSVLTSKETLPYFANERVIIATGGFSGNKAMREKYNEQLAQMDMEILTSCSQGITGDGIIMGETAGAKLVDMEYIQLYPYANPATGIHFYMDNRRIDEGGFYINKEGKRFVNESGTRGIVAKEVLKQTDVTMYEVFTQNILDKILVNELAVKEFNQWTHQGVMVKGDTIGECAEQFLLDKKQVTKTLNRYNLSVKNKYDNDFGRDLSFPLLDEGPYYMLEGLPSVHYTLGGLMIDENARVLDENNEPIENLYAAGEVTGGIHGKERLGACAIPDALVFGRIAGGYQYENQQ